jgi:hypothetical protein
MSVKDCRYAIMLSQPPNEMCVQMLENEVLCPALNAHTLSKTIHQ